MRAELEGNHDYGLSFHDDTEHPHGHLVVLTRGDDGRALLTNPALLQAWRDRDATTLRDHDIAADASPRWARGIGHKSLNRTDFQMARQGKVSARISAAYDQAFADLRQGVRRPQADWEQAIARRHDALTTTYHLAVEELSQSPDPADVALARDLSRFARRMPEPVTRQRAMERNIMAKAAERRQQAEQGRGQQQKAAAVADPPREAHRRDPEPER